MGTMCARPTVVEAFEKGVAEPAKAAKAWEARPSDLKQEPKPSVADKGTV